MNQEKSYLIEKDIGQKRELSTENKEVFVEEIYENLNKNYEDKFLDW